MAEDNKKLGNDAFKAGKFQDAINYYTRAINAEPNNETLYSNRAASYSSINKHHEALADSEKCISLKPTWIKGFFRKGIALSKLNRHVEAAAAFEQALKLEPGSADIQQKLNEERAIIKQQSQVDPSRVRDPTEAKNTGNAFFKEGNFDKAREWYSRVIELTESNPTADTVAAYSNRAACWQQTHAYKQVIADCDNAISIDPNYSKAYMRRAIAFEGLEKWRKAADDYKRVMELDPGATTASTGFQRSNKIAKDLGM
jgi:stress-induced-phosphoprotein 1